MATRAHLSAYANDNDDEAAWWPDLSRAIRASLEDPGLGSTSAPPAIPSVPLTPSTEIASSSTPVPRRSPNPFATSDLRTGLEQPPEFQPTRSILRNTPQTGGSSGQQTHRRRESVPVSLPSFGHSYTPRPVAPQPRPHDSWYSHLEVDPYAQLPTPSPSHPPSAPYLAANLNFPETPSTAFSMTLNTTEVGDGWSTVDPAYASELFPTQEAYPPVYSAAQINATGLPLYPSLRPATDDAPAVRPRRRSTSRAMQPRLVGRDIATGQPTFFGSEPRPEEMVHIPVDNPDEWRQVYSKALVCENVCALCRESRLIPLRFSVRPNWIRGNLLTTPPMDIEQSLVAECMTCSKIHCRGCWQGEYRKPNDPFPAGCIRTDSCITRRVVATFEALRSFDEHYLRFCAGETRAEPGLLVSASKAGRYLALQPGYAPAVISTGLAALVHTLSIIEYYLVHTAMNAHDGYVDLPPAYARMLELSFVPRMIDELFSEPYRRRDVWGTYATTYRHGYNDMFPGYVRAERWDFTLSCGIGMYLRGEGEIEWKASGTSRGPSFLEVIQAFWAPGDPISEDIATLCNALTSAP
ncbi:hypothetical protein BDZ89DRAFT_1071096 [Hymenopellis radicata]|nr:hypothetical protein BDZ89DRAFT_1071096 [Hymenopellis radicata]